MLCKIQARGYGGYRVRNSKVTRGGMKLATVVVAALAAWPVSAQQQPAAKPAVRAPDAAKAQVTQKSQPVQKPQAVARKGPPRGPVERFDCKIGTEDNHARIAVLAQGGEVQSVAYYSKWKPRTCSIHLQRGDAYSRWHDTADTTTVNTEHGDFLIKSSRVQYHFIFRDIDRMHYCGMLGKLNGSMTVTRGPRRQCTVEGVMDRNEPEALDPAPRLDAKPDEKPAEKPEQRAEMPAQ